MNGVLRQEGKLQRGGALATHWRLSGCYITRSQFSQAVESCEQLEVNGQGMEISLRTYGPEALPAVEDISLAWWISP